MTLTGLPAVEYALHSLRVGSSTQLSAGSVTADVIQRERRLKLDAHKGYVRSHGVDTQAVADMLGRVGNQPLHSLAKEGVPY